MEYGSFVRVRQHGDVDRHRPVVLCLGERIRRCDDAKDDLYLRECDNNECADGVLPGDCRNGDQRNMEYLGRLRIRLAYPDHGAFDVYHGELGIRRNTDDDQANL